MPKRVQSPTSIITFRQCPRKYFYQYVVKIPTKASIHLVRGKVAHSVLEDFYDHPVQGLQKETCKQELQTAVGKLLIKHWAESKEELAKLGMTEVQLGYYFEETAIMLINWVHHFTGRLLAFPSNSLDEAFKALIPIREQRFFSEKHGVQGYIDVLDESDGLPTILDYKTSNKADITQEYRLQLAIYSLLYFEQFGKLPARAGLYFLKFGPKYLDVDAGLVQFARNEISYVHENTVSDSIADYKQNVTPLCKWSNGSCDFYEYCFQGKKYEPKIDVPLQEIQLKLQAQGTTL